eukprot:779874-Pelagomonas_calceolata.AAC.4
MEITHISWVFGSKAFTAVPLVDGFSNWDVGRIKDRPGARGRVWSMVMRATGFVLVLHCGIVSWRVTETWQAVKHDGKKEWVWLFFKAEAVTALVGCNERVEGLRQQQQQAAAPLEKALPSRLHCLPAVISSSTFRAGGYMATQWTVAWNWWDDPAYELQVVPGQEMGQLGHKVILQTVANRSTPITGSIEVGFCLYL